MPRSALLCLKIEIWAVTDHLGLELECSRRKNRAAAKNNFATAPALHHNLTVLAIDSHRTEYWYWINLLSTGIRKADQKKVPVHNHLI